MSDMFVLFNFLQVLFKNIQKKVILWKNTQVTHFLQTELYVLKNTKGAASACRNTTSWGQSIRCTVLTQHEPHTAAFFFLRKFLTIMNVSDIKIVVCEIKKFQPLMKRLDRIWLGSLVKPLDRILVESAAEERFTGEAAFSLIKGKVTAATAATGALPVEPLVHKTRCFKCINNICKAYRRVPLLSTLEN